MLQDKDVQHVFFVGEAVIIGTKNQEQNLLETGTGLVYGVEIKRKYGEDNGGERKWVKG